MIARLPHLHLPASFADRIDWRDPVRMSGAALLAFIAAQALHLPEGHWAVLSALVVSRPHRGGSLQAGAGRLAGTLAGVGWAMLVALGRHWQIAEGLLLVAALAPLGALIAWRAEYRTAPIAAIIVLSSAPHGGSPFAAASLRLAEISLGAGIGIAVAWLLLPAGSLRMAERLTARLLCLLAGQLHDMGADHTAAARRLLQRLTGASRAAPWEGGDRRRAEQLAGCAARLCTDVAFLRRCLAATPGATDAFAARLEHARAMLPQIAALLRHEAQMQIPEQGKTATAADAGAAAPVLALLEQDLATLLRLAKKWRLPEQPPGQGEGTEEQDFR